jgi:hypothetical protein
MTRISLNGARKRNGIEGGTGMIEIFSLRDSMDDDIDMGLVTFTVVFCRMDCRERLWISNRPSSREVKSEADVFRGYWTPYSLLDAGSMKDHHQMS